MFLTVNLSYQRSGDFRSTICFSGFTLRKAEYGGSRSRRRHLFIAFDLLVRNGIDLAGMNLSDRRRELEDFAKKCFAQSPTFRLSPASTELTDAQRWLKANGGGTDGVMAKRLDLPLPGG